jgi:probable HAF family extracellular repeat protein
LLAIKACRIVSIATCRLLLEQFFRIGGEVRPRRQPFEEANHSMRQLDRILTVIGFEVRANIPAGQKRFPAALLATFALSAALVLLPARAKAAYVATELAVLTEATTRVVRSINGLTEVVGGARLANGRHQGFLLDGRVVPVGSIWGRDVRENDGPFQSRALAEPIEGIAGTDYSTAYGINDFGDIAGAANIASGLRAFRSRRKTPFLELGPLPGDTSSAAFGINLRGEVVGYSSRPNGTRAVIWNPGGIVNPLPTLSGASSSRALAINDPGDVVGVSETTAGPRATLWARGGTAQDLGTLPGHGRSEALSINESGDVVGSSGNPQQRRAVLWVQGGSIRDLGTLPGGVSSRALGISKGEVVGTSETSDGERAFLWTDAGGMQDLNSLLISRSGFVLTQAVSINSQGIILAVGQNDDSLQSHEKALRIFMLVPTP